MNRPQVIARGEGVLGEVVLRERPGPVHELIVNGVFLMDTAETTTERLLATAILARHATPRRLLVGGLGLGVTLSSVLADPRVDHVDVVEIEPLLVSWLRSGIVPGGDVLVADPKVRVHIDDVRDVLGAPAAAPSYDAVLLDVDNGPDFLVHDRNAAIYEQPFLAAAARHLAPGGLLAVWSAEPAPDLAKALAESVGPTDQLVRTVTREGREVTYCLYVASAPAVDATWRRP